MILGFPIATGNTAKIYLHEGNIVKVFNDYLPPTESEYEANKQRFAYSCGLPVPKVLEVTKIDGKQAIIMEYVKGKTIGDLLLENRERMEYYIEVSVDINENSIKFPTITLKRYPINYVGNLKQPLNWIKARKQG